MTEDHTDSRPAPASTGAAAIDHEAPGRHAGEKTLPVAGQGEGGDREWEEGVGAIFSTPEPESPETSGAAPEAPRPGSWASLRGMPAGRNPSGAASACAQGQQASRNPWKGRLTGQGNQNGQEAQADQSGFGWKGGAQGANTAGEPVPCPYYVLAMKGKPWRKRHPILFWGGILLLLFFLGSSAYRATVEGPLSGPRIAIVNIEGMILDSRDLTEFIATIGDEAEVRGVLIRINSPGGAVAPSQEIFMALERLAKMKPVVASMSTVAASGGYYVALPATRIFAAPSTLTASIGVKMEVPNVQELLGKLGISTTTLASGDLKDAGNPARAMTAGERAYFQGIITDMYTDFIENVAKHRKMKLENVRAVADGRAMTGRQALAAGLVDELGDRNTALRHLASLVELAPGSYQLMEGPKKKQTFLQRMVESAVQAVRVSGVVEEMPMFFY